jgi:hypothetical protein
VSKINPTALRSYLIRLLRAQYKTQKGLEISWGAKFFDNEIMEIVEASYIEIHRIGIVYYNSLQKGFYYVGNFPGHYSFGSINLRLAKTVQGRIPPMLEQVLVEAFTKKEAKTIPYTRDMERQLFKLS